MRELAQNLPTREVKFRDIKCAKYEYGWIVRVQYDIS